MVSKSYPLLSLRFRTRNFFISCESSGIVGLVPKQPYFLKTNWIGNVGNGNDLQFFGINPEDSGSLLLTATFYGVEGPAAFQYGLETGATGSSGLHTLTIGHIVLVPPDPARSLAFGRCSNSNYNDANSPSEWRIDVSYRGNQAGSTTQFTAEGADGLPITYVDAKGNSVAVTAYLRERSMSQDLSTLILSHGLGRSKSRFFKAIFEPIQTKVPGTFTFRTNINPTQVNFLASNARFSIEHEIGPFALAPRS